jgi:hypothetical protein
MTVWSTIYRGSLKNLLEHERDYSQAYIPAGSPILIWEKVSWWRSAFSKPPIQEQWPIADPGQVAYFCFEAGSEAEAGWRRWSQSTSRTY